MEEAKDIQKKNQEKKPKEWRFGQDHTDDEIDIENVPEITTGANLAQGMKDYTGGKMAIMFSIKP